MNRYALGGAIGLLIVLALSGVGGLGQLLQGNGQGRDDASTADDSLGTLPIEQAGQVVQRQGDPTSGVPATGTNLPGTPAAPMNGGFTAPAGTPPTLSPTQPQNVIPRQGVTTLPAQVGILPRCSLVWCSPIQFPRLPMTRN